MRRKRAQSDTRDMNLAQLCRKLDAWDNPGRSIIEVIKQKYFNHRTEQNEAYQRTVFSVPDTDISVPDGQG